MLQPRQIERIVKGFANHRRIEIMQLLSRAPGLSLMAIARRLKIDFRTAGEHVRRLNLAELVSKRHQGAAVIHALSDLGRRVLKFLRTLE